MTDTDPLAPLSEALGALEEWHALDAAKLTIERIPDSQLLELRLWISDVEQPRREREAAVEQGRAEERQTIADQIAETNPDLVKPIESDEPRHWAPWHPLVPETHFRYGDRAIGSDGQIYISQVDPEEGKKLNVWDPCAPGIGGDARYWIPEPPVEEPPVEDESDTPGEDAGAEDTEPDTPSAPDYKQPTGGHDAYKKGDQVTYQGAAYESLIDGNVWAPDAYPAGWRKL